ncbi:Sensors of blue-light using FAD [Ectothiorhodospira magna]|uniref:Sensors of blue-light using FAD n=1 Tax=Ectothiorhodospira magna TaxID=867345 RepID=A0A1H9AE43_9GAMM|nr:BLUF domain-containing protein [Ectothiorhodospira magna]SEP75042.1 Sensors of blue-light using FAD [Ectothiorhodospira magna]
MIYQLVYISEYTGTDSKKDLQDILTQSRRLNPQSGITGMLLFIQDSFIQVLEGEREHVQQTYARIAKDPRHGRLDMLLEHDVPKRLFPDWSMAWMPVTESELCTLAHIDQCDFETLSRLDSNIIGSMLLTFAETQSEIARSSKEA